MKISLIETEMLFSAYLCQIFIKIQKMKKIKNTIRIGRGKNASAYSK